MAFQDWSIPEQGSLLLQWRKGTSLPTPVNFTVNLRDIFGEPEAAGFDTLEYSIAPFGQPPSWISITGGPALGTYNLITTTGIQLNLSYGFTASAFNLSPGQTYSSFGIFIFGRNGNGARQILTFTSIVLKGGIFEQTQPFTNPAILTFNHPFQALAPQPQLMSIDAFGEWSLALSIANFIDVEIVSGSLVIVVSDFFGSPFLTLTGNGSGTISIRPSQSYLDTLAIAASSYDFGLGGFGNSPGANSNWYYQNIGFLINVIPAEDLLVSTNALYFNAIKTVFEAPVQTINITSNYAFTLILPPWATSLPASGIVGLNEIDIAVALSSSLDAGNYTENIIIQYENGNGTQQYLIPITYLVEGFVVLPYLTDGFNFTLDNKMVSFYTDLENTFFEVLMNVKAYDFYEETFNSYIIPLKIPLLRGRQIENIGLKIHRLMKRFKELNTTNTFQYKTCEVFLQVKEKDLDTLEIQREFTLENVQFIAGVTPVLSNGMGILSLNNFPTRVTSKSFQFINLLIKNGSRKIEILKNDNLETTYYVNSSDFNIYKDTINFETLDCVEGDIIEYKLFTDILNVDFVSKKYFVFPEESQNIIIIWEDDYKLQSNYEFTGEYLLKYEFESKTFKKYKNIVEVLENVQTNREVKCTVNTGAILNTDQITIDSICRARKAWLLLPNKTIEIIPQTKSFIPIDSDREISSFDLEFIINKQSNEEVYTF